MPPVPRASSLADPSPPDVAWLEPLLALGSRPYPEQRAAVAALGIAAVITLHDPSPGEAEHWAAHGVEFYAFPTRDWVHIAAPRFDAVLDRIVALHEARRPVLLHCLAGINRAPTVAAALLCQREGVTPDEAVARVRAARPSAAPSEHQMRSLRAWAARHARRDITRLA